MLPHARDTERVGRGAHRDHDSVVRQLKLVNGTLTPLADHGLAHYHLAFRVDCGGRGFHIRSVFVQAADRLRDGAIFHRPDRGTGEASA